MSSTSARRSPNTATSSSAPIASSTRSASARDARPRPAVRRRRRCPPAPARRCGAGSWPPPRRTSRPARARPGPAARSAARRRPGRPRGGQRGPPVAAACTGTTSVSSATLELVGGRVGGPHRERRHQGRGVLVEPERRGHQVRAGPPVEQPGHQLAGPAGAGRELAAPPDRGARRPPGPPRAARPRPARRTGPAPSCTQIVPMNRCPAWMPTASRAPDAQLGALVDLHAPPRRCAAGRTRPTRAAAAGSRPDPASPGSTAGAARRPGPRRCPSASRPAPGWRCPR